MIEQRSEEPRLLQVFNGWQAHGTGWAVSGTTEEESRANYWKAAQRRQEILVMPPYYLQEQQHAEH